MSYRIIRGCYQARFRREGYNIEVAAIHELRYTYITRAKECGVAGEVVMKWVGHEFDVDVKTSRVDRGYTDYSEEFLLKENNKIEYNL